MMKWTAQTCLLFLIISLKVSKGLCDDPLPINTRPLSYYLSITSYIHQNINLYYGSVDIRIQVKNATDTIVLHSENLAISEINLEDDAAAEVYSNLSFTEDIHTSLLEIRVPKNVTLREGNEYILSIVFAGELTTDFYGFYQVGKVDSKNRSL